MDPTSPGFLTQVLNTFINVFSSGFGVLTPRAQAVLGTLAAIEIALAALFWALRGQDFTAPFLRKLLRIGFFTFLVASWPTLTQGVANGLADIGAMAAGGSSAMVTDPSRILDQAFVVIQPIADELNRLQEDGWMGVIASLAVIIQYILASFLILVAFAILAVTCFVTVIEFFMVAVLGLILVPWGISNHTSFLAEKAIGAVIAQGVKLMVLSFIIAVYGMVLGTFTLPPAPELPVTWMTVVSAFVLTVLAVHAPAVAGGLLSGSPSLTAGSAAGVAIGAGAAAIGAGVGAAAVARMGAASAGKTIAAAGQIHGASSAAIAKQQALGGSTLAQAGSALGAGSRETAKIAASPITRVTDRVRERWNEGRAKGEGSVAAAELRQAQRLEEAKQRFRGGGAATAAHATSSAVKGFTTTSSGGSGNPTIRHNDED